MRFPKATCMLAVLLEVAVAHPASAHRPLEIDDLFRIQRISNPSLSPDGRWIAFVVTIADRQANQNNSTLWLVSLDGGTLHQVSTQRVIDGAPAWSPDGRLLAFESSVSGTSQIWCVASDGTAPRQFTYLSTGASQPVWSPDGKMIAFVSDVFPEYSSLPFARSDSLNRQKMEKMRTGTMRARVITGLLYRHWSSWVDGKRKHIFVQPVDGGKPVDRTPGDRDAVPTATTFSAGLEFAFSPDGNEIAYTATPVPIHQEAWSTNHDIYTVSVRGGSPKQFTTNPAADGCPRYSPDGRYVAYRAQSVPGFEADRWQIMLYDRATGKVRRLTESFDGSVKSFVWSPRSTELYFEGEEKANMPIFAVSIAGNDVRRILVEKSNRNLCVTPDGKSIIFSQCSLVRPVELFSIGVDGKRLMQITRMNDTLFAQLGIPEPETAWYEGAGGTKIQAWLIKPPSMVPGRRYPFVYLVHGGPQNAWLNGWSYRWNPVLWAAQGYVVMAPNPRGSTGFGQQFVNEISGDWGGKVYVDLLKGLDYAGTLPYVDTTARAAAGASFGGYMMNWFEGHVGNKFKAFVTHAGVYNFESMYGTTEEVWFDEWDHGGTPWDKPEEYRRFSPHVYAGNFSTPTLVIHSEQDFRVPYSESMQLFTALQRQGIPSKFVLFPDEGHVILKPANSDFWHRTVFDWLARYLKASDALQEGSGVQDGTRDTH